MSLISLERMIIQKIFEDEAWYEGERRGRFVPVNDFSVVCRVIAIIEREGEAIQRQAQDRARTCVAS